MSNPAIFYFAVIKLTDYNSPKLRRKLWRQRKLWRHYCCITQRQCLLFCFMIFLCACDCKSWRRWWMLTWWIPVSELKKQVRVACVALVLPKKVLCLVSKISQLLHKLEQNTLSSILRCIFNSGTSELCLWVTESYYVVFSSWNWLSLLIVVIISAEWRWLKLKI